MMWYRYLYQNASFLRPIARNLRGQRPSQPASQTRSTDKESPAKPVESFSRAIFDNDYIPTKQTKSSKPSRPPNRRHNWTLFDHHPPDVDPATTSILLFPGQGSQFVGMAKDLLPFPGVKRMFEEASEQLKQDVLKVCLTGPEHILMRTSVCQPAIYVTSLAAIVRLKEESPAIVERCVAAAGFSIGEITALVFSGAMTFEEGLHLVRVRSDAMQRACDETNGGMMTVFLTRQSELGKLCSLARDYCKAKLGIAVPICQIANYLYAECVVIAGHKEALDFVALYAKDFKIRRTVPLKVSGAFHTPLMGLAEKPMKNALEKLGELRSPAISVLSNFDALPHSSPGSMAIKLVKQVTHTVRWEQCLHNLYMRPSGTPFPKSYEAGPGDQLGAMLKMVNNPAHKQYVSVKV